MKIAFVSAVLMTLAACGGVKSDTNTSATLDDQTQPAAEFKFPSLPVLISPKIKIHKGPELAAVQPTAELSFSYKSCAKRNFQVTTKTIQSFDGKTTYVQVSELLGVDCMGPAISRNYKLQISSDTMADGAYAITNPSVIHKNSQQ